MTQRIQCADGAHREQAVASALAALRRGDLVVLPTESVYAVAADAFSRRGVATLREAKGYEDDAPLPVMVGGRSTVSGIAARVSADAEALMTQCWPGALTLLLTPQPSLAWDLPAAAPLAVRMPLHPVALAVLQATGPLVVTAANLPGLPAPTDVDDALAQAGDVASLALDAGPLGEDPGVPSTIVDATTMPPRVVRQGAIALEVLRRSCPSVLPEGGPDTA